MRLAGGTGRSGSRNNRFAKDLLQKLSPGKARRIIFATARDGDIQMSDDHVRRDAILRDFFAGELNECVHLRRWIGIATVVGILKLDTERHFVDRRLAAPRGAPGMPGGVLIGDQAINLTCFVDQVVR